MNVPVTACKAWVLMLQAVGVPVATDAMVDMEDELATYQKALSKLCQN